MRRSILLALLAVASSSTGCRPAPGTPPTIDGFTAEEVARVLRMSPLPKAIADPTNGVQDDPRAIALGELLFHDPRMSRDGDVSCATCHDPALGFGDGKALSHGEVTLARHTPTLWNVAGQRWFFWDGRVDSLWAQACAVLESPLEMAGTRTDLLRLLAGDPELRGPFEALFGALPEQLPEERFPAKARPVPLHDPALADARAHAQESEGHKHASGDGGFIHPHQRRWDAMSQEDQALATSALVGVAKCLAAFQATLRSTTSPLDAFVEAVREGDPDGGGHLSAAAQRGLGLFVGRGRCHLCHSGPFLSDREFHDVGLEPIPERERDEGRHLGLELLGQEPFRGDGPWSDDPAAGAARLEHVPSHGHGVGEFKTPGLREVASHPPYMHTGIFASLADVVAFYSDGVGRRTHPAPTETILEPLKLTAREQADLVAFLESLTSTPPASTLGPR